MEIKVYFLLFLFLGIRCKLHVVCVLIAYWRGSQSLFSHLPLGKWRSIAGRKNTFNEDRPGRLTRVRTPTLIKSVDDTI